MNHVFSLQDVYSLFFSQYPDVLTTYDVQEILGISNKTLYHLLHTSQLRSIKVGHCYRIPKIYLLQYLGIVSFDNP